MATLQSRLVDVPAHIPPEFVYDYDIHQPAPPGADVFEELYRLKHRAPPIFWTPRNGGHWYTPDGLLARQVMEDNVNFSSQSLMIPREFNPPKGQGFTPIHLDPPEHGIYRKLVQLALSRRTVVDMLPHMRTFTIDLIERLKPGGRCEFINQIAYALPTQVFLYLVDLPEKYHQDVRWRVFELHSIESDKAQLFRELQEVLLPFVQDRIANPGDDLVSWLAQQKIDGETIAEQRVHSITTQLLTAGLGVIADTFGCIFLHLARNPEHRRWLQANPEKMNNALEELLRRYPVILGGTARLCVADTSVGPATVGAQDMILATPAMMNFDDQIYKDPLAIDFERAIPMNNTFGHGPHRCAGTALTRSLLGILAEEWLARIPDFTVNEGETSQPEALINFCYEEMILEWQP